MNLMQAYASSIKPPYFMRHGLKIVTVSQKVLYLWFFQLKLFLSRSIFK